MNPWRSLIVSAVFLAVLFGVFAWLLPVLPARVPTHWNGQGRIDGYMTPWRALGTMASLLAMLAVLTVALPAISPRRYAIASFAAAYSLIMLAVQGVVFVVTLGILLNGSGWHLDMPRLAMLAVGVLLMVLGNYMGKLRPNFFAGIRTPWTLASAAVWERTHRLAGWVYVLAGAVLIVFGLAGAVAGWMLMSVVLAAALIPVAYSYFSYRRLEGRHSSEGDA